MAVVMMRPEDRARISNIRRVAAEIRGMVEGLAESRRRWANDADDLRRIRDESSAFIMDAAAIQIQGASDELLSLMASLEMIAADGVRHAVSEVR
jgi:DNA polymerase/3'-5' exonuclease PolX